MNTSELKQTLVARACSYELAQAIADELDRLRAELAMMQKGFDSIARERDELSAELAEARLVIAGFQSGVTPCDCQPGEFCKPSAPVPQPAVPEAVAKDSDWKHVPVGRVIGDPVWAGQLWSTQIRGTKKLRHGDLVFIHPAAILSATEGRKDE